jgi:hypothetical protein
VPGRLVGYQTIRPDLGPTQISTAVEQDVIEASTLEDNVGSAFIDRDFPAVRRLHSRYLPYDLSYAIRDDAAQIRQGLDSLVDKFEGELMLMPLQTMLNAVEAGCLLWVVEHALLTASRLYLGLDIPDGYPWDVMRLTELEAYGLLDVELPSLYGTNDVLDGGYKGKGRVIDEISWDRGFESSGSSFIFINWAVRETTKKRWGLRHGRWAILRTPSGRSCHTTDVVFATGVRLEAAFVCEGRVHRESVLGS